MTPLVVFIMLNPSTADADHNDPTIAKCIKFAVKFAIRNGWIPEPADRGALVELVRSYVEGVTNPAIRVAIVNLYAVRATDPDVAFAHPRPIGGLKNDEIIAAIAHKADIAIAAWGADKRSSKRAREVYRLLRDHVVLHRLGCASKDGSPKHPLYLRDATELEVHSW